MNVKKVARKALQQKPDFPTFDPTFRLIGFCEDPQKPDFSDFSL